MRYLGCALESLSTERRAGGQGKAVWQQPCPQWLQGRLYLASAFPATLETYIIIFPLLMTEAHWRGLKTRKGQMLAEGYHPEVASLWLHVISFSHNDTKAIFIF